jgi:hypothetical protein
MTTKTIRTPRKVTTVKATVVHRRGKLGKPTPAPKIRKTHTRKVYN